MSKLIGIIFTVLVGLATIVGGAAAAYNLYKDNKSDTSLSQSPIETNPDKIPRDKNYWAKKYILSKVAVNLPQSLEYTIVITNGSNTLDLGIVEKIGELYRKKQGVKVISTVLNSTFVSNGIFDEYYRGDVDSDALNAMSKHIDYLVLGKSELKYLNSGTYSNIEGMQNLVTTEMSLSLRILSLKTGQFIKNISLNSTGIGATKNKSFAKATNRILADLKIKIL